MTSDPNKLEEYLGSALAGSLVGQIAARRNITFRELLGPDGDGDSPTLRALTEEITELGLDPELLATHSLYSLVALFSQETNADLIASQYTSLLWSILGDPKNGGSPPEIYRRAGVAMHLALLGILDPSLAENRSRS